jgi:hypothetical protein
MPFCLFGAIWGGFWGFSLWGGILGRLRRFRAFLGLSRACGGVVGRSSCDGFALWGFLGSFLAVSCRLSAFGRRKKEGAKNRPILPHTKKEKRRKNRRF